MNIEKIMHSAKRFVDRNGATILTCVGAAGTVGTAVMAAKATPKALVLVENAKEEKGEELTKFETVITAAPAYIPTIITGVTTLACIFGANVLNKRQQAALMSAYALLDNSFKEYKQKIGELYGEGANEKVREEIAKDKYEDADISVADDKRLFYDNFSQRYFESTLETVQNAEYWINRDLSMRDYATVNEFYEYLGIAPIDGGDEIGWSSGMNFDYYWQSWIDFGHQKVMLDETLECIIITMFAEPCVGYNTYA